MSRHDEQFDDGQMRVSPRLGEDLKAAFQAPGSVRPEVDRGITDAAYRRLVRPGTRVLWLRWAGSAAAVAAVLAISAVLWGPWQGSKQAEDDYGPANTAMMRKSSAGAREDVDGSGRVDILDAYILARRIESGAVVEARWDFNGDGTVDSVDVDAIAVAAVRLDKGVL